MWPFLGSLFTGAMGLFGASTSANASQANNAANIQMQRETNQLSMEEAQRNRDYQTQMSNTAYQRASSDMKQAGLNPAMMFGSGSAASSPGGAQAPVQAPQARENPGRAYEGLGDLAGKVVNSAISAKTFEKMTEEIANIRADTAKVSAVEENVRQSTKTEEQETWKRNQINSILSLSMPGHRVSAAEYEAIEKLPSWLRDLLSQGAYGGKKVSDTVSSVGDLVHSAAGVKKLLMHPDNPTKKYSGLSPGQRQNVKDMLDDAFSAFK